MKSRFSISNSPLKKAPSAYKKSPKKKIMPKQTSPSQFSQQSDFFNEEIIEEKTTPKKQENKTTPTSSGKVRPTYDTFYQQKKQEKTLEELKEEYNAIANQYEQSLELRESLKNDCQKYDEDLDKAYKQQRSLCKQLKKKNENQKTNSHK